MSLPGNGIFVVQGEMAMLVTAMRRSTRWGSHSFPNEEYDVLMRTFQDLKSILHQVEDLRLLDPSTFLSPFLEVIRSKETTGPVTSLALSAINKFLSYGLIDPTHPSVPATVEDIADAVTHARFVGTDHSSDGVVLMKILQVLRTLMLSPEGAMLTDESVCEIMLSCFRICFETRLTELLRRNAEQCLRDMTQLIFMRLPQFPPEGDTAANFAVGLSLKKRDKATKKKSASSVHSTNSLERKSSSRDMASPVTVEGDLETNKVETLRHNHSQDKHLINEEEITISPGEPLKPKKHARHSSMDLADNGNTSISQLLEKCVSPEEGEKEEGETEEGEKVEQDETQQPDGACVSQPLEDKDNIEKMEEYVNQRGIRFTPQEETVELQPYGLVCVRELFRFLISLCNPLDPQNTSAMVHLGLCLVGTSLEVASDHIAEYPSLLQLIKDPLCRSLLSLLSTERISIFALDLQVSFLLFEALRYHLKYQMEAFFKKMIEIISADTSKAIYELKEIHHLALESLIQLFRIPGLCTELYLNYDCDVYCMNIFEELTKLLSKNVVSSTAYNIHTLSLEALLTIIEAIELGINEKGEKNEWEKNELGKNELAKNESEKNELDKDKYGRGGHISLEMGGMDDASVVSDHVTHDISQYFGGRGRPRAPVEVATEAELDNIRNMKKWVTQGTELFNQKPERGIEFLQEHGVLSTPLDPHQVAIFLRENPDLDKKMIGEYICKRSSRDEDEDGGPSVLSAFADSFDYTGLRIEQALRLYLETFRLPGEAPLIFLVMERFAERWHSTNGEPFANTDAAFRLAYAVIMLNMDQHNHNAKKLNVPMTVEDFVKNLRGCNGSGDFEQTMLEEVYYAIKNEEMVMPAERTGPVRDAYLWRVLQRRGQTARPYRAPRYAHRLLHYATPNTVTALSAAFERAAPPTTDETESNNSRDSVAILAMSGLERCASLLSRHPSDGLTLDSLLLTLCKFTSLLSHQNNYIATGVTLGQSSKAQLALHKVFSTVALHANCVSQATWTRVLELVAALYSGRLLPKSLVEVEDYLAPEGKVSLVRQAARGEAGLLSSIYSYIALGETGIRAPTPHEKTLIDIAADCVEKCNIPAVLITETKFMQAESLQELIQAMVEMTTPPDAESLQENPELEDLMVFFLELLGQTLIQNRDRPAQVCSAVAAFPRGVLWAFPAERASLERVLTCCLRAVSTLMRAEACAACCLPSLAALLQLPRGRRAHCHLVIACGLYDVIKTSAQNIHTEQEWQLVLQLICAVGAGAWPKQTNNAPSSRSEGSEEEERRLTSVSSESELSSSPQTQGWIWVQENSEEALVEMRGHSVAALSRCCEALALVVRDVAHVTPHNLRHVVRAVRLCARSHTAHGKPKSRDSRKRTTPRRRGHESSDDDSDSRDQYHLISIQLLDLMHTLHSRTAQIFKWWQDEADQENVAKEYDLWEVAWKPLLQGIAQFCTDRRKQVANTAIAYLQRALLAPGLCSLAGSAWHECFSRVLFPLMHAATHHSTALRANTILCKVFLQHLSALSSQTTFASLWTRVIQVQRSLVANTTDGVTEAAQESLKNMILVMDSVRVFRNQDGYNDLWYLTWEQVGEFLPSLKEELFPHVNDDFRQPNLPNHMQPSTNLPTVIPVGQNSTPSIIPQPNLSQTIPTPPQTVPTSPQTVPTLPQTVPTLPQNVPSQIHSPVNLGHSPMISPALVAPVPISGMVPIRNQLYDQPGLTSSVLLQPLNEMVSTPIGISIHNQMPILYPQTNEETKNEPNPPTIQPTIPSQTVLEINYEDNIIVPDSKEIKHSELYAEYLTNPYTEMKELSAKEATLYDPETKELTVPQHLIIDQKSLSANTTPMHTRNKAQFGSTDNVRPDSGIFDYSSYFGGAEVKGDVFDAMLSSREG